MILSTSHLFHGKISRETLHVNNREKVFMYSTLIIIRRLFNMNFTGNFSRVFYVLCRLRYLALGKNCVLTDSNTTQILAILYSVKLQNNKLCVTNCVI